MTHIGGYQQIDEDQAQSYQQGTSKLNLSNFCLHVFLFIFGGGGGMRQCGGTLCAALYPL